MKVKTVYRFKRGSWASKLPGAEHAMLEARLRVSCNSKLSAKLLVFASTLDFRTFWHAAIDDMKIDRRTLAIVHDTACEVESFREGRYEHYVQADKHYFAIIAMLYPRCFDTEVISHEAVHAALAYTRRVGNRMRWVSGVQNCNDENSDESLCYATGRIAAAMTDLLIGRKASIDAGFKALTATKQRNGRTRT